MAGSSETVAYAADCFNPVEGGAEFLSQRGDMHIDIAVDDERIVVVDIVEELVARQNFPAIGHQSAQDAEFGKGERNDLVSLAQNIPLDIESKVAELHHLDCVLFWFFAPAEDGFDAGEENLGEKGF